MLILHGVIHELFKKLGKNKSNLWFKERAAFITQELLDDKLCSKRIKEMVEYSKVRKMLRTHTISNSPFKIPVEKLDEVWRRCGIKFRQKEHGSILGCGWYYCSANEMVHGTFQQCAKYLPISLFLIFPQPL